MEPIKEKKRDTKGIVEDKKMKDYSQDPVFVAKAQEAADFLQKHPLSVIGPADVVVGRVKKSDTRIYRAKIVAAKKKQRKLHK